MSVAIAAVEPAPAREPAATALSKIREQHWELRQLLAFGLEQVGEETARVSVPMLIRIAYHAFVRHLADEEALRSPCDHCNYCAARIYTTSMACHKRDEPTPEVRRLLTLDEAR